VTSVRFEYLHHLVTVPVAVGEVETTFVVDSGIGLTLVRSSLAEFAGVRTNGASFTGRRMSGQEVAVPLGVAPAVTFAGATRSGVDVGILDMSGFPAELDDIGGFLSLAFFAGTPFTVDYARQALVVETPKTLAARVAAGVAVPIELHRDGPSVDAFLDLVLPGGRTAHVEVDMGSDVLILDERFAAETGAPLGGPDVRRVEGVDETGHAYTRTFTRLAGAIHPAAAPELAQDDPDVMFQSIVHDGLVGHAFLGRHTVTWDVAGGRLLLGPG